MTTPRRPGQARTSRPDPRDPYGDTWDETYDPPARGGGVSPGVVIGVIALVGSLAFAVYVITVRDASQIPLMASGAVVLAIVFIALAAYSLRATWRAGLERRDGRAIAIGFTGGIAALIGAMCVAGAIILFLLATGGRS